MLYIDTSNIEKIKKYKELGIIEGITTNQKILLKDKKKDITQTIQELLNVAGNLPLHVELTKTNKTNNELISEASEYYDMSPNKQIVIKVPMWGDGRGLKIAKDLQKTGIPVNITCCMSVEQVIMASLINVNYVSLFYNRIMDYYTSKWGSSSHHHPCKIISLSKKLLITNEWCTGIIVGSIRKPCDVTFSLINGADIVTVPPEILSEMFYHPKTEETIKEFNQAWKKLQKS